MIVVFGTIFQAAGITASPAPALANHDMRVAKRKLLLHIGRGDLIGHGLAPTTFHIQF